MEALQERFRAANTQVLGVSIDSVYSHTNWAASLGGISFPLLADFHPKGAVASSFGLYLEDAGITDRATVIIDADGVVRHVSSVTPSGRRDIAKLAALCEEVDAGWSGERAPWPQARALGKATLFVKDQCMFSTNALSARTNLHLEDSLKVANVSGSPAARDQLRDLTGNSLSPCLVVEGKPMHESADIMKWMAERAAPLD